MNPDLDETDVAPVLPSPVTPLTLRLFEAIGEPMPGGPLPVAFSYADLSDKAGWKAQIEAAERLSRAGAIAPNLLLGLYTTQKPAASGGVWDRVAAFQELDAAVSKADIRAVDQALPVAWVEMKAAELEVPLAAIFADRLSKLALGDEAAEISFQISLLSSDYESLSAARATKSPRDQFLAALATGDIVRPDAKRPDVGGHQRGLHRPVDWRRFQPRCWTRIASARSILLAMARIEHGTTGDLRGVTEGLSVLRHIGLEDAARRTALELMLLDRRG